MSGQREDVEWFADVKKTGPISDLMRSMADVVEELENRPATCLEPEPGTDWVCCLRDHHRGEHASTDGHTIHRWVDE